jgi:hypothetical protein
MFKPYEIQIDTIEEHQFMLGLFLLNQSQAKEDADNFTTELDKQFYEFLADKEDTNNNLMEI